MASGLTTPNVDALRPDAQVRNPIEEIWQFPFPVDMVKVDALS